MIISLITNDILFDSNIRINGNTYMNLKILNNILTYLEITILFLSIDFVMCMLIMVPYIYLLLKKVEQNFHFKKVEQLL